MTLMNPLEAAWLYVDTTQTPMHVASLQIYSPPEGAPEDFVGRMLGEFRATRTCAKPWNQKLAGWWFDRLFPTWTTDEDIDLDYHVRHSALPRPGGERELGILVSRLHSHPLDLARPPWEVHFIEGLDGGRFAIYAKMHHSLIDGISGMRLLQRKLSRDPNERFMLAPWAAPDPEEGPDVHRPAEAAPSASPVAGTLDEAVTEVVGAIARHAGTLGDVGMAMLRLVNANVQGDDSLVAPLTCPWSIINGRVTGQRRFATAGFGLDEVKSLARDAAATVNDIVLAICSGALRRFLAEADALPDAPLTAGLPVDVRPADDQETGTAISFICANLATTEDDPAHRLALIKASTQRAKAHLQELPRAAMTPYTLLFMAPHVLQLLSGLGGRLRPVFNVTISNVPGPERPLYLNGARLEAMYPVSLLSHGQALNITCLSYAGRLNFGFTGCRDTLPHMQRLAVYAREAFAELREEFAPRPQADVAKAEMTPRGSGSEDEEDAGDEDVRQGTDAQGVTDDQGGTDVQGDTDVEGGTAAEGGTDVQGGPASASGAGIQGGTEALGGVDGQAGRVAPPQPSDTSEAQGPAAAPPAKRATRRKAGQTRRAKGSDEDGAPASSPAPRKRPRAQRARQSRKRG
jgi:WS/DGAT/MGAT family acyltransferase